MSFDRAVSQPESQNDAKRRSKVKSAKNNLVVSSMILHLQQREKEQHTREPEFHIKGRNESCLKDSYNLKVSEFPDTTREKKDSIQSIVKNDHKKQQATNHSCTQEKAKKKTFLI